MLSPYQPTVPESTAGLLDRGECPDLQENVGAAPEPSRNLRPQRTRRLPERLRDFVVNFLWGTSTLILSSELCTIWTFGYFRRRDFILSIVDFIVSGDFFFHVKEHFSEERRDVMHEAANAGIAKPCAFDSGGHVTFAMKLVELNLFVWILYCSWDHYICVYGIIGELQTPSRIQEQRHF